MVQTRSAHGHRARKVYSDEPDIVDDEGELAEKIEGPTSKQPRTKRQKTTSSDNVSSPPSEEVDREKGTHASGKSEQPAEPQTSAEARSAEAHPPSDKGPQKGSLQPEKVENQEHKNDVPKKEHPESPAKLTTPQQEQKQHEEETRSSPASGTAPEKEDFPANEVSVIEEGDVFFYCRPKIDVEDVESISEAQRFYMILDPKGKGSKSRLAVMGKKRLPSATEHERFFGFIEAVSDDVGNLVKSLGERQYETKTRGTRVLKAAKEIGKGTYSIELEDGHYKSKAGGTRLHFELESPPEPGELQSEFQVPKKGSYVMQVKSPANEPPVPIGLTEKADYPREKMEEFENYSWIAVMDTSLLNYQRTEFLLVATSEA